MEIDSAEWLDNGEEIKIKNEKFGIKPFMYRESYSIRIAKIRYRDIYVIAKSRLIVDYLVIGIRLTIDGRRIPLKVREALAEEWLKLFTVVVKSGGIRKRNRFSD